MAVVCLIAASAAPADDPPKHKDDSFRIVPAPEQSGLWDELRDESNSDYSHGGVLFFPTLVVADVPVYNLEGVRNQLNFTPQILAGIFLGQITYWDDPLLAKANPRTPLPHERIRVIHREDESSSTVLWTDYLSKVSIDWSRRVGQGAEVRWPVGQGIAGDAAITDAVKQTAFSISYVERFFAVKSRLTFGRVQNSFGSFVRAEAVTVQAAATERAGSLDFSSSVSITNPAGQDSYPIAGFSGLLLRAQIPDIQKRKEMIDFLRWVLTEGQKSAATDGYVPLPREVVTKELKALDAMSK